MENLSTIGNNRIQTANLKPGTATAQTANPAKMPSFKGAPTEGASKAVTYYAPNVWGKVGKFIEQNFSKKLTDLTNAAVTAVGTSIVAPIFIVCNPLSKASKEDREYSAWRQPLSAIIAFGGQFLATKPFMAFADRASTTYLQPAEKGAPLQLQLSLDAAKSFLETEPKYKELSAKISWIDKLKAKISPSWASKEWQDYNNALTADAKQQLEEQKQGMVEKFIHQSREEIEKMSDGDLAKFKKGEAAELLEVRGRTAELKKECKVGWWDELVEAVCGNSYETSAMKEFKQKYGTELTSESSSLAQKEVAKIKSEAAKAGQSVKETLFNFKANKICEGKFNDLKAAFGRRRNILSICLNLLTLPVTCTILNWAYPKFANWVMGVKKDDVKGEAPKEAAVKPDTSVKTANKKATEGGAA